MSFCLFRPCERRIVGCVGVFDERGEGGEEVFDGFNAEDCV